MPLQLIAPYVSLVRQRQRQQRMPYNICWDDMEFWNETLELPSGWNDGSYPGDDHFRELIAERLAPFTVEKTPDGALDDDGLLVFMVSVSVGGMGHNGHPDKEKMEKQMKEMPPSFAPPLPIAKVLDLLSQMGNLREKEWRALEHMVRSLKALASRQDR